LSCPGETSLLFVINSSIPKFALKSPDLRSCQIELNASDYPFLEHDSYVNCVEVKSVSKAEIERQILQDIGRIKGELNATTKREIIRVVQTARTINARHKRLVIEALK
jgi:hypothetical protein